MSQTSKITTAHLIGDAVMMLLQSKRRVTLGNILDVLEHKKHAANGHAEEDFRDTITYLRSRGENL